MQRFEAIFLHGWGFGSDFWQPLLQRLGWESVSVPDFGFLRTFSGRQGQDLQKTIKNLQQKGMPVLAVGHSLGFSWLVDQALLPVGSVFVGFNAFGRFVSGEGFTEGVPERVLHRMQRSIKMDPLSVVNNFRKRCGAFPVPCNNMPHVQTLCWGLTMLKNINIYAHLVSLGSRVVIMGGTQDNLVSPEMLKASVPHTVRLVWQEGGHLLPQTHVEASAMLLQSLRQAMEQGSI